MRRRVLSSTSLPSPPNTASSTDWLSLGEVRTYMPPAAPMRAAEKRTDGAGASSRSSQVTPVEFNPAMMARFRARDTRLACRARRPGVGAPARGPPRPFLGGRAEGGGHPQDHLGGEVDVADAGHALLAAQPAGAPALPDDPLGDGCARCPPLGGVDLDVRLKDRPVADVGVVADDHAVLHPA